MWIRITLTLTILSVFEVIGTVRARHYLELKSGAAIATPNHTLTLTISLTITLTLT